MFSRDVTAAMLLLPINPPGIELYSYAKIFCYFGWINMLIDHESESTLYNGSQWRYTFSLESMKEIDSSKFATDFEFCLMFTDINSWLKSTKKEWKKGVTFRALAPIRGRRNIIPLRQLSHRISMLFLAGTATTKLALYIKYSTEM